MKQSFRVPPVATLLLAIALISLPLAAQSVPGFGPLGLDEALQAEASDPSAPLQDASVVQDTAPQTAPDRSSPVQTTPAAPTSRSGDEAEKANADSQLTAKEAIEESTKGNGGRVFGVLPNYRTTNEKEIYKPLRVKDKWLIASHDVFDPTNWVIAGVFGGIHQANDAHPEFGQGVQGYAKYYATAYLDQAVGNIMTEGVFATVFHQDPRYFRKGTGSFSSRLGHAMGQSFVTRSDSGQRQFNSSEWVGNAVATSMQNLYYDDSRNARANAENYGAAMLTDMASQILKEFWPDIKKHVHKQ